jgi:hypothetical protein
MAKVQFNCRLESDIAKWIVDEAVRRDKSQADVITSLVVRFGKPQPAKKDFAPLLKPKERK